MDANDITPNYQVPEAAQRRHALSSCVALSYQSVWLSAIHIFCRPRSKLNRYRRSTALYPLQAKEFVNLRSNLHLNILPSNMTLNCQTEAHSESDTPLCHNVDNLDSAVNVSGGVLTLIPCGEMRAGAVMDKTDRLKKHLQPHAPRIP